MTQGSALEIAQAYHRRGWQPVPVPARSKNPGFTGWQKLRLSEEDLPKRFNANGQRQNVGILLGAPSGGLIDIDLDLSDACALGAVLLPQTGAIFGRPGKPKSHFLYLATDPAIPKTMQLDWPGLVDDDGKSVRIVELRSTGLQTIFPGSVHDRTGEEIRWDVDGEPAHVPAAQLTRIVPIIAAGSVLVSYWQRGWRNKLSLALSGALLWGVGS
jgi:hypothetical protein